MAIERPERGVVTRGRHRFGGEPLLLAYLLDRALATLLFLIQVKDECLCCRRWIDSLPLRCWNRVQSEIALGRRLGLDC